VYLCFLILTNGYIIEFFLVRESREVDRSIEERESSSEWEDKRPRRSSAHVPPLHSREICPGACPHHSRRTGPSLHSFHSFILSFISLYFFDFFFNFFFELFLNYFLTFFFWYFFWYFFLIFCRYLFLFFFFFLSYF
jgi:hypothetical protein